MAHTIVIFGASGDLTSRKLIPALYRLFQQGRLPEETRIVGVSRTRFTDEAWRSQLATTTQKYLSHDFDAHVWKNFAANVFYSAGDVETQADFVALKGVLEKLEAGKKVTRVYYLSTAPRLYADIAGQLGAAGMADETNGPRRIVIEKPFGT